MAFLMACFMGVWSSKARRGLRRPLRGQRSCATGRDAQLVPLLTSTLPPPLNFAEAHLPLSPGGHRAGEMAGLSTCNYVAAAVVTCNYTPATSPTRLVAGCRLWQNLLVHVAPLGLFLDP